MNNETSLWSKLRKLLCGTAAGVLVCMILLVLFSSAMVLIHRVPKQALTPMAWIAALSAAFVAGLVSGIVSGRHGLLYGLSNALLLYGVLFLCGMGLSDADISTAAFIKLGCMMLAGMAGGVCGVNRRLKY